MPYVYLGNTAPINPVRVDEDTDEIRREPIKADGPVVTEFQVPDQPLHSAFLTVTRVYDEYHSDEPPIWVESDDTILAAAIAQHYTTDDHTVEIKTPGKKKKG